MAAIHILIFGEVAGFKNSFVHINTCENEKKFSWSYEKIFPANQNSPICMKTTDIKLFGLELWYLIFIFIVNLYCLVLR